MTAPYTPQQNGLAERKNRTLVEPVTCLLTQSGMPLSFWGEALISANYIRNRCPIMGLNGKIPYEIWHQHLPNLNHIKIFGSKCFAINKKNG